MSTDGSEGRAERREALFPALLRHWRTRRGLSQLDLALLADVSSRHLSFLETGRSQPSDTMVVRLATALDLPLRQVNAMLRSAGFAPRYVERAELPPAVAATVALMATHHEPFPLVVLDRGYEVLDVNQGALRLLQVLVPGLTAADLDGLNLARFTLSADLGGRLLVNHQPVARELMWRLQRELLVDPGNVGLRALVDDLLATPGLPDDWRSPDPTAPSTPTLDLQVRVGSEVWSFVVVLSALLAPLEVALDELRVEQWFPADEVTALGCAALVHGGPPAPAGRAAVDLG